MKSRWFDGRSFTEGETLQAQLQHWIVEEILAQRLGGGARLPSTRTLATDLGISRNTVSLAYQSLIASGYIESRPRSGLFVCFQADQPRSDTETAASHRTSDDLSHHFNRRDTDQFAMKRPRDWQGKKYPFVYGQIDENLFPGTAWRECVRRSMGYRNFNSWTNDRYAQDDPLLVEQICQKILVRRGIFASPDEILITMGAQNSLYLIASLFLRPGVKAAVEEPGYHDARNIFRLHGAKVQPVPVDAQGMDVTQLRDERLAFLTPSHQFPTNVTMSLARRRAILEWASEKDAILVEDDYEFETNFLDQYTPALKSLDTRGRVFYVGSLSKSLMPGIRMGFVVAPSTAIEEMRIRRRMMMRHPPGNNQRAVALFLSSGHHDALLRKMHRVYKSRWLLMQDALREHFPDWSRPTSFGGSAFWLKGPEGFDSDMLAERAVRDEIIFETGWVFFDRPAPPRNFLQLGISCIPESRIPEGVRLLSRSVSELFPGMGRTKSTVQVPPEVSSKI